jgi:GNAT superfamily N-acetyltransferase
MIRPTLASDTPALLEMTDGTGVFKPGDLETLGEVLDTYHAEAHAEGHRCVTFEQDGRPIGFAYYAPAELTDRTWHLWWIVVSKQIQAKGVGSRLLRHVEDDVRAARGRLLVIETSSLPAYELTRRFYLKQGYDLAAVLQDFYADGDSIVFFTKRLGA